ncbi:MAG: protein phosphatase 2C domain-containing protein [archaeon]|nr:protein phosphatase 2C domain-containing protein [archaeon]
MPVDESGPVSTENPDLGLFSISTYPILPGKTNRSGHPIADSYGLVFLQDGSLLASLADGCNWGEKARNASLAASKALIDYILTREAAAFAPKGQNLGHLLLRGFATAHELILEGVDQELSEAGTTTLLGTIVTPIDRSPDYMILTCSVGDTKAFLYSIQADTVQEISGPQSRCTAADPGGRLGPHIGPHGEPDLRNLYLQSTRCSPGDILLMVTDGVYDNLDPMYRGLSPKDCGFKEDAWIDTNNEHHGARARLICSLLRERFILKPDGSVRDPPDIVSGLCVFLTELTQSSRDFHHEQPNKKLPRDFLKYPGKMDHSTAICVRLRPHRAYPVAASSNGYIQEDEDP